MESRISDDVKLEEWFCPIYNRKIDCGLCFDIPTSAMIFFA